MRNLKFFNENGYFIIDKVFSKEQCNELVHLALELNNKDDLVPIMNIHNLSGKILDYMSNGISMDPVNLFKWANNNTLFIKKPLYNIINCSSKEDDIYFVSSYYNNNDNNDVKLGNKLIEYTDKVYYKNGIYDKVYYDSTLTEAKLKKPYAYSGYFKYKDLNFTKIHSIFYFEDKINFIGGMWDNIFN